MPIKGKAVLEDVSVEMQLGWYRQMCLIRAFEREVYQLNTAGSGPWDGTSVHWDGGNCRRCLRSDA